MKTNRPGRELSVGVVQPLAVLIIMTVLASWAPQRAIGQETEVPTSAGAAPSATADPDLLSAEDMKLIRAAEDQRIRVINQVVGSVIAVYGQDRQGGGSGVIIDPSGIALTNHHVIQGSGMSGLGGLDDGELYEWDLIGTDPGGDVAVIRLKGRDEFPFSPLGDSDKVQVGDWALAMGNPFLLAHDQVPTVTLGVVSGVERFQEGAGSNQLVYGNCIQIDSSINPGNSGGPLFNMNGEVIGINGRGSFRDRGRVNVGLGYAISSNQIRNFIPDLMATKIVEHGTLDAGFSNRDGRVVCSTINLDAPVAKAGLELGDELLEFEGRTISYANQFKNIICTLPEDWPATLKIRKEDGRELQITVRLFGLPYNFQPDEEDEEKGDPDEPDKDPGEKDPDGKDEDDGEEDDDESPEQKSEAAQSLEKYLLSEPGVVINEVANAQSLDAIMAAWNNQVSSSGGDEPKAGWKITDEIRDGESRIGEQTIHIGRDGKFQIDHKIGENSFVGFYDGSDFWQRSVDGTKKLTLIEAKTNPVMMQAAGLAAIANRQPLAKFGKPLLDGGDKTAGRISNRVIYLDEDDDWLYCWFSIFDDTDQSDVRLQKISANRDCLGAGGILNSDWHSFKELSIPRFKHHIRGLQETVVWTAVTTDCQPLDALDTELFLTKED